MKRNEAKNHIQSKDHDTSNVIITNVIIHLYLSRNLQSLYSRRSLTITLIITLLIKSTTKEEEESEVLTR